MDAISLQEVALTLVKNLGSSSRSAKDRGGEPANHNETTVFGLSPGKFKPRKFAKTDVVVRYVATGKVKQHDEDFGKNKKEDRRKKAASGKSGGGTQGRETKTKATKNKGRGKKGGGGAHESDSDDDRQKSTGGGESPAVEFLSVDDMQTEITNFSELVDCPEELVEELTNHLHNPLTRQFQEIAKSVFMATVAVGGDARRKTHQQLQDKVSALLTTIKLSEKSIKHIHLIYYNIETQLIKWFDKEKLKREEFVSLFISEEEDGSMRGISTLR
ncbi:E3 UFM1-protein ligase 1 [Portunus trituberculatus]|uniref:E3 UFM1-protein ligase 1 n=1 Tax=Portunus trituberculatus TaxID=210409 RepID=A0A5B7I3W0_PORTR|nr:E3 UFM1-protein ligase 1 [Portunus trituberculatus]